MSKPARKTKSQIRSSGAIRGSDSARELLAKTGRALAKPGISKASVFRGASKKVFAYSVYSKDPSKIVRQAADGTKTIGRVVDGKFRAS